MAFKEIVTKAVIGKGKKHFNNNYTIEVDNIDRLRKVINSLQSIPEVYSVKRVSANNGHKVNDLNNHHNKKRKKENNKK